MKRIISVDELTGNVDSDNLIKFEEDVEFVCDVGDWRNQLPIKIESTGSLYFKGSVNVINLNASRSITSNDFMSVSDSIFSGENVTSMTYMSAFSNIVAFGYVHSIKDIKVGGCISSGWYVKASGVIKAGSYIEASFVSSDMFLIKCEKLITTHVPFSRHFWCEMPPLRQWKKKFLENDIETWTKLKNTLSRREKEIIIGWEGWHPILSAHLLMVLGMRKEVEWEK